jgi:hypothetical protein
MADALVTTDVLKKPKGDSIKLIIGLKGQNATTLAESALDVDAYNFSIRNRSDLTEISRCTFTKTPDEAADKAAAAHNVAKADYGWLSIYIGGSNEPGAVINQPSFEFIFQTSPKAGPFDDFVTRMIIVGEAA